MYGFSRILHNHMRLVTTFSNIIHITLGIKSFDLFYFTFYHWYNDIQERQVRF